MCIRDRTSSDDFYAYEEMNKDGNYIGQGTVTGEILFKLK